MYSNNCIRVGIIFIAQTWNILHLRISITDLFRTIPVGVVYTARVKASNISLNFYEPIIKSLAAYRELWLALVSSSVITKVLSIGKQMPCACADKWRSRRKADDAVAIQKGRQLFFNKMLPYQEAYGSKK